MLRKRNSRKQEPTDEELTRQQLRLKDNADRLKRAQDRLRSQERLKNANNAVMLLVLAFISCVATRRASNSSMHTGIIVTCSLVTHSSTIVLMVHLLSAAGFWRPGREKHTHYWEQKSVSVREGREKKEGSSRLGKLLATYIGILAVCFVAGLLVWQVEAMYAIDLLAFAGNNTDDASTLSFADRSLAGKVMFCAVTGTFGPPYIAFVVGRDLFPCAEAYLHAAWFMITLQAVWEVVVDAVTVMLKVIVTTIVDAIVWVADYLQAPWSIIVDAVMAVVNLVLPLIVYAVVWVQAVLQAVVDGAIMVATHIADAFVWVSATLQAAWQAVAKPIMTMVSLVVACIVDAFVWVSATLQAAWQAVAKPIMTMVSLVVACIVDAFVWVSATLQAAWQAVAEPIMTMVSLVVARIVDAFVWVSATLQAMWHAVADTVMTLVSLITTPVTVVLSSVSTAVSSLAESLRSSMADVFAMFRF